MTSVQGFRNNNVSGFGSASRASQAGKAGGSAAAGGASGASKLQPVDAKLDVAVFTSNLSGSSAAVVDLSSPATGPVAKTQATEAVFKASTNETLNDPDAFDTATLTEMAKAVADFMFSGQAVA